MGEVSDSSFVNIIVKGMKVVPSPIICERGKAQMQVPHSLTNHQGITYERQPGDTYEVRSFEHNIQIEALWREDGKEVSIQAPEGASTFGGGHPLQLVLDLQEGIQCKAASIQQRHSPQRESELHSA